MRALSTGAQEPRAHAAPSRAQGSLVPKPGFFLSWGFGFTGMRDCAHGKRGPWREGAGGGHVARPDARPRTALAAPGPRLGPLFPMGKRRPRLPERRRDARGPSFPPRSQAAAGSFPQRLEVPAAGPGRGRKARASDPRAAPRRRGRARLQLPRPLLPGEQERGPAEGGSAQRLPGPRSPSRLPAHLSN